MMDQTHTTHTHDTTPPVNLLRDIKLLTMHLQKIVDSIKLADPGVRAPYELAEIIRDTESGTTYHQLAVIGAHHLVHCVETADGLRRRRLNPENTAANKEAQDAAVATAKTVLVDAVRKVNLLELKMPNGKRLRDCTCAEATSFGGWLIRLGACGTPEQLIGDVVTEDVAKTLLDPPT